ncbi:hypothetical protein, partial [Alienimonas chondri]|uniref:hypothetical protein n=1 Tax=Alienimonas chondri TaxID=2681879 RepID=UPI001489C269
MPATRPAAARAVVAALAVVCGSLFVPASGDFSAANVAVAGPGQFEDAASLADAVADGRNLERARKWGEAIRHYD